MEIRYTVRLHMYPKDCFFFFFFSLWGIKETRESLKANVNHIPCSLQGIN